MMIDRTTSAARTPATTIEVRIPDGRDTSIGGNPIHVDADVLYDAIDLLQILVLLLDPLKGDDDTDLGAARRGGSLHDSKKPCWRIGTLTTGSRAARLSPNSRAAIRRTPAPGGSRHDFLH